MKASFTKKEASLIADACFQRFIALENESTLSKAERKEHRILDALLHGGAVPPPLSELILALVYGPHRPQSHRVHEARIPLAKLDLKMVSIRKGSPHQASTN